MILYYINWSQMIKNIIASLLLLITCLSCGKAARDSNTLVVGTNAEFAPYTYIEKGELVGFDIDVAHEVAKRLNKKIVFKDMPFDALIPDLSLGNIDIIAAGMSYTDERAKRVSFTEPYCNNDPLVIVTLAEKSASKELSVEDLKNKTVVVNDGYVADIYMSDTNCCNLVRIPAPADAFLALKSGRADAFVTAQSTADFFLVSQKDTKLQLNSIPETNETCALVVAKDNPLLLQQIQTVLDEMDNDGTMGKIKDKWKLQ